MAQLQTFASGYSRGSSPTHSDPGTDGEARDLPSFPPPPRISFACVILKKQDLGLLVMRTLEPVPTSRPVTTPRPGGGGPPRRSRSRPRLPAARGCLPASPPHKQRRPQPRPTGAPGRAPLRRRGGQGKRRRRRPTHAPAPGGKRRRRPSRSAAATPSQGAAVPPGGAACARARALTRRPLQPPPPAARQVAALGVRRGGAARRSARAGGGGGGPPSAPACEGAGPAERAERGGSGRRGGTGGRRGGWAGWAAPRPPARPRLLCCALPACQRGGPG